MTFLVKIYVTLDPNIANPYFIMFNERKLVFSSFKKHHSSENRKHFETLMSMLGEEMFSDGDHCWEVRVPRQSIGPSFGLRSLRKDVYT